MNLLRSSFFYRAIDSGKIGSPPAARVPSTVVGVQATVVESPVLPRAISVNASVVGPTKEGRSEQVDIKDTKA